VLHNDDKSFVLGSRAGTLPGGGDVLERSLLGWPAPFEITS